MTIEGTYENGHIILTEQPPFQAKTKVLVTFIDTIRHTASWDNVVRFGTLKGKISIPDDFNEPLDDLKEYMY